jgi:hypothetical protein
VLFVPDGEVVFRNNGGAVLVSTRRFVPRLDPPLAEVLDAVTGAEARLTKLRDSTAIPDQPDRRWVEDWLHRSYLDFWARRVVPR